MSRIRSETLMQSVAFGILLTVVCRALGFGRGVLLVRILDPADLGTWALMANAVQLLGFVFAFGLPSGMSRYVGRFLSQQAAPRVLLMVGGAFLSIALAACGVGMLFWPQLGKWLFSSSAGRGLVLMTLAAVLATVAYSLVGGVLQGLKLFRANCLLELLQNAGFLVLTFALFLGWETSVFAPAWAHLLTTLMMTVVFAAWLRRRLTAPAAPPGAAPAPGTAPRWQPLVVFSLGTWCAGSLQALSWAIDRFMLLHLAHSPGDAVLDQIGQYFVASKLGQPISAVGGILAMALLPHAATLWEAKKEREVERMIRLAMKIAAIGMTGCGAVLVLYREFFLELIAGRTLPYAGTVLATVLITVTAVSLHYIARNYLLCREEAWLITAVWLTVLLANVGLNQLLIPRFEVIGAAAATATSSGLALWMTMVLASRRGLAWGYGTWLAAGAPLILLAPAATIPAWLTVLGAATIATNHILTEDEKQVVRAWIARQIDRRTVRPTQSVEIEPGLSGAKV